MAKRRKGRGKRGSVAKRKKQTLSRAEMKRREIEPIEIVRPEKTITTKQFYDDVEIGKIIVSALKKVPGAQLESDERILVCITKDCRNVLHQIIENGSQYISSGRRKKFTIEDFNKGLNYYNW